jgi:hypothetical protein
MRISRPFYIAIGLSATALILFLLAGRDRDSRIHAWSFVRVVPTVDGTNAFLSNYYANQIQMVSNLLSSQESRRMLATLSHADEKSHALVMLGPVRGTSFIFIEYSGTDSNTVLCVASNAASMAMRAYATNQPSWKGGYSDPYCFTPRSFREKLMDYLGNLMRF